MSNNELQNYQIPHVSFIQVLKTVSMALLRYMKPVGFIEDR